MCSSVPAILYLIPLNPSAFSSPRTCFSHSLVQSSQLPCGRRRRGLHGFFQTNDNDKLNYFVLCVSQPSPCLCLGPSSLSSGSQFHDCSTCTCLTHPMAAGWRMVCDDLIRSLSCLTNQPVPPSPPSLPPHLPYTPTLGERGRPPSLHLGPSHRDTPDFVSHCVASINFAFTSPT